MVLSVGKHMSFRRAQGSVEYLIGLAVVIIIALAVVVVIGGFSAPAGAVTERESLLYWSAAAVAVTRIVSTPQTTTVTVKNNKPFTIRLSNVTLGDTTASASGTLAPGETADVSLSKTCSPVESSFTYSTTIQFADAQYDFPITFIGDKPLIGKCQPDVTTPVITGVTNGSVSVDWAIITWTTNEPADSTVYYNATGGSSLLNSVTNATLSLSHSMNITGLSAGTTISYKVSSSDEAGNNANSSVNTVTTIRPVFLSFSSPTDANGSTVARNYTTVNITLSFNANNTLDTFLFNWNGTNNTFYDGNLVLGLNFNNNSAIGENATHAVDISKYSNNGTLQSGATYNSSGQFGSAVNLNGTGFVKVPDADSLDFLYTTSFSIESWINFASSGDIVTKWGAAGGQFGYQLALNSSNQTLFLRDTYGGSRDALLATTVLSPNTWYHLAATYNGTTMNVYVNGTLDGNLTNTLSGGSASTEALYVGPYFGSTNFTGLVDEVRLYNRALSASEIQIHYQSEFAKLSSTQWGFYDNVTALIPGNYTYFGFANDTVGQSNQTETRTLQVLP